MRRITERIARVLAVLAALCIGAMMMATVVDVVRRTITGRALAGTVEYSELLMVSLVFLGLAFGQHQKEHVSVNLVTSRLPPRASQAIRVVGLALVVSFVAWMALETGREALKSYANNEIRIGLQSVQVWPARFLIPIGLIALWMQLGVDIADLSRGREVRSAALTGALPIEVDPDEASHA